MILRLKYTGLYPGFTINELYFLVQITWSFLASMSLYVDEDNNSNILF